VTYYLNGLVNLEIWYLNNLAKNTQSSWTIWHQNCRFSIWTRGQTLRFRTGTIVKYCDNELVHVQLWDIAQYSKHWDIKNVDLQFVILEKFVSTWGIRFEWHVKFKGVTFKQFNKLWDSWFGIILLLASLLNLFLVLLECSCWFSSTRHLGSLSMEELTCSKGWDSSQCNVGIDSSLLASLVEKFALESEPCWTVLALRLVLNTELI